ncbi:MAG TPA: TetR/AcrR family transcriptional regulator [Oligoflexia bacterium]|nr:TetR/AcrR family transcriptional regulator [Oligoflexia bacterium]HMP49179.1 TetR/AcrR family transcriptional regulator [Oligoflexia bacterium]
MNEHGSEKNEGVEEDLRHPRERILNSALELFVDQGYFNTNVPKISAKSKCSVGSIYHHFINKQEIASSLYLDGIRQFRSALEDSLSNIPLPDSSITDIQPLEITIRNLVVAFLCFAEDHRMLSQYLWLARHNEYLEGEVTVPTRVGFDSLGRKLTKTIKHAIRANEIPLVKADILWTIVFGIPLSYVRDWLEGHTSASPKQVASTLANACWAALHEAR